jgi:hypothetical protein
LDSSDSCGHPDSPALTLRNTIVANGHSAAENCNGSRHSIFPNDDSCGFEAANDSLSNTDPLLDPNGFPSGLQDNGGPTMTIALQEDSPAIDAIEQGANACATDITEDKRGVMRLQNGNSDGTSGRDLGAFETEDDIAPPSA